MQLQLSATARPSSHTTAPWLAHSCDLDHTARALDSISLISHACLDHIVGILGEKVLRVAKPRRALNHLLELEARQPDHRIDDELALFCLKLVATGARGHQLEPLRLDDEPASFKLIARLDLITGIVGRVEAEAYAVRESNSGGVRSVKCSVI